MERKLEVLEKLAEWIVRTVEKKDLATPEEVEALPKVAEVYFKHHVYKGKYKIQNEFQNYNEELANKVIGELGHKIKETIRSL